MNEAVISARRASGPRVAGLNGVAWGAGLALVLMATLFRAGNRFVPLMVLEWLALGVLAALVWSSAARQSGCEDDGSARGNEREARLGKAALGVLLTAPFWWAGLQLLPVFGPISQVPTSTWLSMLAGLPVMACLALPLAASDRELRALLWAWLGVGVFQAMLGLLQLGFPGLLFDPEFKTPVLGTFGNRNGLANFLVMMLPLILVRLLSAEGQRRERRQYAMWITAGYLLLVLAGLLATLSRTGIATGALVVVLSALLLPPPARTRKSALGRRSLWPFVLIGLLVLTLLAGGWDWLARFDTDRLINDDQIRALNRASTWAAVNAYWPWGAGLGTFTAAFPQFAAPEMGAYFVNAAHNDYLELLMELGALAIPVALAVLWVVSRRLFQLTRLRRQNWSASDRLAVACGIALLAQFLHAWVDYPWQIPANAMLGAFMLGVFLREPKDRTTRKQHVK